MNAAQYLGWAKGLPSLAVGLGISPTIWTPVFSPRTTPCVSVPRLAVASSSVKVRTTCANEGSTPPESWNQLLRDRVASGELLNLDTIDLGFMRPRSPQEWHLAYCQSLVRQPRETQGGLRGVKPRNKNTRT